MKKLLLPLVLLLASCSDEKTEYGANCGVVIESELFDKVDENLGDPVEILGVPAPDLVSVKTDAGRSYLVKLQGITAKSRNGAQQSAAINWIKDLGSSAFLLLADEDCRFTTSDNTSAQPGQLFLNTNTSISEELLLEGLVDIDSTNACRSNLLNSCYSSLILRD